MQVSRSAPLTSRGVLVAWAFPEEVVEVGSVTVQHLRQGPADMCAGLERGLYLRATYLSVAGSFSTVLVSTYRSVCCGYAGFASSSTEEAERLLTSRAHAASST